jgi:hypothetical protein
VYFSKDNAANTESANIIKVNIDTAPPSIVFGPITPAPNGAGWNNTDVTVPFTANDNLSGVAATSPGGNAIVLSSEGSAVTGTITVTDFAGNSEVFTTQPFKIDKTPPVVIYAGNLGNYTVEQTINIMCSVQDGLSGVASSTCQNIVGPAYIFALGMNSFSATASDCAGNIGTGSTTFIVRISYDSLATLVNQFVTKQGIITSLLAKLEAAKAAEARGNANAKTGAIGAFINEVQAQSSKTISEQNATVLIALAKAL